MHFGTSRRSEFLLDEVASYASDQEDACTLQSGPLHASYPVLQCDQASPRLHCQDLAQCSFSHASALSLDELASSWPELAALRAAASSPNVARFRYAISSFISHARIAFAAALVALRKADSLHVDYSTAPYLPAIFHGLAHYQASLALQRLENDLISQWHLSAAQAALVRLQLRQLVSSESADSGPSSCDPPVIPSGRAVFARFPHVIGCFLSALARGWPWTLALEAFRNLDQGRFF